MRRIGGVVLALQMAAGLLLPLCAFARPSATATMACCMTHGRCDCGHSDASFARCTGQDAVRVAAVPPATPPAATGRLAVILPGLLLASRDDDASDLFDFVPPTPPPRAAA